MSQNNTLLACIAFHYVNNNLQYLNKIINSFINEYDIPVKVIIDTNTHDIDSMNDYPNISVVVHSNLKHPYHLTWMHRQHMMDNISNYDNFMYLEHDMYLPFKNYLNYLDNFKILFPAAIPSFIRIEELNNEKYIVDVTHKQKLNIYYIEDKKFLNLDEPYHAFWIMPKEELLNTMLPNFVRVSKIREEAAYYPMQDLQKMPLIEIDNTNNISEKCYSYHLTNNYISLKNTPFAKIKVKELFISKL